MAQSSKAMEDLRTKTDDQLVVQLGELKRVQFNLRFLAAPKQRTLVRRLGTRRSTG